VKVTLWGVRGSLPTPLTNTGYTEKLRSILSQANGADLSNSEKVDAFIENLPRTDRKIVGGNTTCVSVQAGNTLVVLDAGSGLRLLGQDLMGGSCGKGEGEVHLFFSHHHHDHTNGFPFFVPAYIPGNTIHFYGIHPKLEDRMVGLQVREYFPVPFHVMASKKFFHQLESGKTHEIGGVRVTPARLKHPGDSYGYRVEYRDQVFVFASDSEYRNPTEEELEYYADFFRDADLVYFDGQYTLVEAFVKEDWGHSTAMMAVDLAARANVKKVVIGHHDPAYPDETVVSLEDQAREYRDVMYPDAAVEIVAAFEGDVYDLGE